MSDYYPRNGEALRESEERYRVLFNLSPVAVYSIDASGVVQEFNRVAAELESVGATGNWGMIG